jgi:hypothetical protein
MRLSGEVKFHGNFAPYNSVTATARLLESLTSTRRAAARCFGDVSYLAYRWPPSPHHSTPTDPEHSQTSDTAFRFRVRPTELTGSEKVLDRAHDRLWPWSTPSVHWPRRATLVSKLTSTKDMMSSTYAIPATLPTARHNYYVPIEMHSPFKGGE